MLNISRVVIAAVLVSCMTVANASGGAATITLDGVAYQHRWSQEGQHEFTPKGQEDLTHWQDMVTVNAYESVGNADQLKELTARALVHYRRAGKILRAASGARSESEPTEYFLVVLMGSSEFIEAAFARIVLIDGTGFVLVRSRRAYGANAAQQVGEWVQMNGVSVENNLLALRDIPSLADLKNFPESK